MPRFVLLHHCLPPESLREDHWDFMLEVGDVLWTWALEEIPEPGCSLAALQLADHRLAYLDYEGPVSGNRGHVRQCDAGEFAWIEQSEDRYLLQLSGARLAGRLTLERETAAAETQRWLMSFSKS